MTPKGVIVLLVLCLVCMIPGGVILVGAGVVIYLAVQISSAWRKS
jgi:hypothetical protein